MNEQLNKIDKSLTFVSGAILCSNVVAEAMRSELVYIWSAVLDMQSRIDGLELALKEERLHPLMVCTEEPETVKEYSGIMGNIPIDDINDLAKEGWRIFMQLEGGILLLERDVPKEE